MSVIATNPILSGFYPDPSICAVGEDFYLVSSTFAYFPGLPVMHSRDLAHWEQIGNAMDRKSQLPLDGAGHSQGLFAPTIRYHDGTFYIVCTNVSHGGNFAITAKDPAGPWSEPYYIKGADGIDPSLFFDDDGACYYIGTHPNPQGCRYDGDYYIWIQQLDTEKMELVGEPCNVWNGAMKNIIWPEGPHLYKKDGYYYIVHAEGGTGPDHAVAVCRSRAVMGPYQNNFCNPVLTHRHLGKDFPVQYAGHADLVQTVSGDWYMVMLAVRPRQGYTLMGRETFLARVIWENDWPVVNPGKGMLTDTLEVDLPEWNAGKDDKKDYHFEEIDEPGSAFLALRNPDKDMYVLEKGKGLLLRCSQTSLKEKASPSYLAVRQRHHKFVAKTLLCTENLNGQTRAGMAYVQSNDYHLRVEAGGGSVQVILCENGKDRVISAAQMENSGMASVQISVDGLNARVSVESREGEAVFSADPIDIRALSTEVAGGFVGCTVGMYAYAENQSPERACFKKFSYSGSE